MSNFQCNLPVRSFEKDISIFLVTQKEKQVFRNAFYAIFLVASPSLSLF